MWPFKKKPAPAFIPPTPPAPAKTGTVVLSFNQVCEILPALAPFGRKAIVPTDIGLLYDTLRNSVITPPPPWPKVSYRFEHLLFFPSDINNTIAYFVFYPL